MENVMTIASLLLSVAAIGVMLIITFHLYRKYRFNYLASYFYYFVFMTGLSIYGGFNLDVIQLLFRSHIETPAQEVLDYCLIFLALPLLIVAEYMIIRFFRELVNRKISRQVTILYFSIQVSIYAASGIVLYAYSDMEQVRFFRLIPVYETLYAVIDIAIWSIALSQVLIHGRTLNDPRRRRTALMLFGQYVFIVVTTYLTLYPLRAEGLWYGIRVLFQSSVELIPVLYLRSYLARNYKLPIFTGDLHPDLMPLLNRYQITKRETEIITYICEGKSNREIAETLFISLQTVKDHIYRIFQKTGVKSRIQLSNLVQEHLARPVKIE